MGAPPRHPMAKKAHSASVILMLLAVSIQGCLSWGDSEPSDRADNITYPSIWERHTLDWETEGSYSMTLEKGPYSAMEVKEARITVDT